MARRWLFWDHNGWAHMSKAVKSVKYAFSKIVGSEPEKKFLWMWRGTSLEIFGDVSVPARQHACSLTTEWFSDDEWWELSEEERLYLSDPLNNEHLREAIEEHNIPRALTNMDTRSSPPWLLAWAADKNPILSLASMLDRKKSSNISENTNPDLNPYTVAINKLVAYLAERQSQH